MIHKFTTWRPHINRTGLDCFFSFKNYGKEWKLSRRAFQSLFSAKFTVEHEYIQLRSARHFLKRTVKTPERAVELTKL